MGTITATPNAAGGYVKVVVDASDDLYATGVVLKRARVSDDPLYVKPATVRPSSPLLSYNGTVVAKPYVKLSKGWAVFYDYEAPIGQAVQYSAETNGGRAAYTRKNLVTNPSFETNLTGWVAWSGGSTLARVTTFHAAGTTGTAAMQITCATAGIVGALTSETPGLFIPVQGGRAYSGSIVAKTATAGRTLQVGLIWLNAAGVELPGVVGASLPATVSNTEYTFTFNGLIAPPDAAGVSFFFRCTNAAVGETYLIDAALLEAAPTVGAYIDTTATVAAVNPVAVAASAAVTLTGPPANPTTTGWLKDPQRPGNNVPLVCAAVPGGVFADCDTGTGVYFIGLAGRRYAADAQGMDVPGTPRGATAYSVRKDFSSQLRLFARSLADRDALEKLCAPGSPLLLQLPPQYGERDQYIQVGDVSADRIAVDQRVPWRAVVLPYTVEDAPEGVAEGPVGARWPDLITYPTWTSLKATGKTWGDLGVLA